jgi:hypothetical protein
LHGVSVTSAWTAFVHVKAVPGSCSLPDWAAGGFTYVSAKCEREDFEELVRRDALEHGLAVEDFEWVCELGAEPPSDTSPEGRRLSGFRRRSPARFRYPNQRS